MKTHTTAFLQWICAQIAITWPQLLSNLSLLANSSLLIACLSFSIEISYKTSQLAIYTFGPRDSNLLMEHFSTWTQLFAFKNHIASTQFMSANIPRGALGMEICQLACALLSAISGLWLISQLGPVVYAVSIWAHAAMLWWQHFCLRLFYFGWDRIPPSSSSKQPGKGW